MAHFHAEPDDAAPLRAIVDASDDVIIGEDLDGMIVSWNRGDERLYGYTAGEVRRRSTAIIILGNRGGELAAILQRVKSGERIGPYETVRRARDGRLLDIQLTASPILNTAGDVVVGSVALGRDVTARNRADTDPAAK